MTKKTPKKIKKVTKKVDKEKQLEMSKAIKYYKEKIENEQKN